MRQKIEFHEVQRLAPWVFVLMGAISLGGLAIAFVQLGLGRPVGNNPTSDGALIAIVAVMSILFPAFIGSLRLETETTFDGVKIRYWPLLNRTIPYGEIQSAIAQSYNPLLEYGGWGIRGFGRKIAYNARGNKGVLLTLKNGATIMVGSQQPYDLEAAINSGIR